MKFMAVGISSAIFDRVAPLLDSGYGIVERSGLFGRYSGLCLDYEDDVVVAIPIRLDIEPDVTPNDLVLRLVEAYEAGRATAN